MKGRFAFKHLCARITFYFSIVIIVSFLILGVLAGKIFSDKWTEEMDTVILQKMGLVCNYLDSGVMRVRDLHYSLLRNSSIRQALTDVQENGYDEQTSGTLLKTEFDKKRQNDVSIVSLFTVAQDGTILDPWYAFAPYDSLVTDNTDFEYFVSQKMLGYFSKPSTYPLTIENPSFEQKNTITYYGRYYDTETFSELGYLLLNLKKSVLFGSMSTVSTETFSNFYISNGDGEIVFESGSSPLISAEELQTLRQSKNKVVEVKDASYLMYQTRSTEYPDWHLTGFVSYTSVKAHIYSVWLVIALIAALLIIVVIVVSFYISQRVTRPLRTISTSMELLGQGIWPSEVTTTAQDELKHLTDVFNRMITDIQKLQEEILDEQEQKQKIELAMVKSQLDLLQSQINPHFIHNTLNTLKYMAQKEGNTELAGMITSFNTLLRSSMSRNNDLITVAEEVSNLENYMNIQKHRYDACITVGFSVSKEASFALLPKLILQPLLENALFHGIIPKQGGEIQIVFDTDLLFLYISVTDNGVGIQKESLNSILSSKKGSGNHYNSIGIPNVNERLLIYYGEESRLHIASSPAAGTSISFKIPFTK
ncbi:MAG: sensor histidine kinase [Lachnospiraceae bacterium]